MNAPRSSGLALLLLTLGSLVSAVACAPEEDDGFTDAAEEELRALPGKPADRPQLPDHYEALSAVEKQALLAQLIQAGEYCASSDSEAACLAKLPKGGFGYYVRAIPALLSLRPTFHHASDEAPEGRRKIFHPFGVAGTAEFVADYTDVPAAGASSRRAPYTGLLANGGEAIPLILRLAPGGGGKMIPGASVKFLIDGKPARNFVAIHDFSGLPDDDWNYFSQDLGHIYPEVPWVVKKYFQTVTANPSHLPITHLGDIARSGAEISPAEQSTPYEIVLRPTAAVATRFPNTDQHDFRFDLTQIEPGTAVYDVMARATKDDATFERLGSIRTTSRLIASEGGDRQLYFKHSGGK
ncbi:MAG: hypothetical protein KF894_09385 [Labilithrix sp.]|nr:hypothetical protein [Labilithrix sp.]